MLKWLPFYSILKIVIMSFDIDKLAHLSRIALDDEDHEAMTSKLTNIVAMIDQLQSVHTEQIEPMVNPLWVAQRYREDQVSETDHHQKYQTVAPKVAAGLYLVPKVIE